MAAILGQSASGLSQNDGTEEGTLILRGLGVLQPRPVAPGVSLPRPPCDLSASGGPERAEEACCLSHSQLRAAAVQSVCSKGFARGNQQDSRRLFFLLGILCVCDGAGLLLWSLPVE